MAFAVTTPSRVGSTCFSTFSFTFSCLSNLQWARENGCPWDVRARPGAEQSGNLSILKWANENGCP